MTYLDFLEQKVLLERLVIGLEEPVLIKGLGELSAKIDSGNGGYNVIHGTDFHQQGNELMFTTHDSFGHEKKMQATVIDTIEVNMGGGNIENRPVIELDLKFAGEDYKKIPFSVSDRSTNTNPILISKGFVENELEALIDVGKKNISNDGIDVVYGESVMLDEGVLGAIGKGIGAVAKGAAKTAGDIKRGMQTVGNAYNKTMSGIAYFGKWLGGDAKMKDWTPSAQGIKDTVKQFAMGTLSAVGLRSIWKMAARLKTGLSLNSEDPKKIKEKLKASQDIPTLYKSLDATAGTIYQQDKPNFDNVQIIPLFNFSFQKGKIGSKNYVKGMEQQAKKFKAAIAQAKEGVDSRKKDQDDKALEKQSEDQLNGTTPKTDAEKEKEAVNDAYNYFSKTFKDSLLIFEDATTPQNSVPSTPTTVNNQTSSETEVQDADKQMSDDEIKNMSVEFNNLSEFFLWYCTLGEPNIQADKNNPQVLQQLEKEIKGYKKEMQELINKQFLSGKFDADFAKIYASSSPVTPETFKPLIEKMVAASSNIEFEEQEEAPESGDETVVADNDTTEQQPVDDQEVQKKNTIRQNKSKLTGVFCLAYAKSPENPTSREYVFFTKKNQVIYNSNSENKATDDAEKLEQDKNAFTQRVKEIIPFDKANIQFKIDAVQLNSALNGQGAYSEAINAVIDNANSFPISSQYLDALRKSDTSLTDKDKENALAQLSQSLSQEYPLYVINQTPQGHGALAALGNYQWGGEQDFIDKCFENEQARTAILLDDKAPNFAEMENQALINSGLPADEEPPVEPTTPPTNDGVPPEQPPAEPTTPPVEPPASDGVPPEEPPAEPTTPPTNNGEPTTPPTEPSSTSDDRTPRFNDMEKKIGKSLENPNDDTTPDTPPATDTVPQTKTGQGETKKTTGQGVPQTKQGKKQHIIDDGNLGVKKTKTGQGVPQTKLEDPAPAPQVKQGEEKHVIDDGNLGVPQTKTGQGKTKLEDPAPSPEDTPPPSDDTPPDAEEPPPADTPPPSDDVPEQQPEVRPEVQDVPPAENPKTSEKINTEKPKKNNDIRVKSRAQMNAHARQNKKAHMKKGKKKGTESEEEPWFEEEEDPWIKSKLQHFRNKGIM